MFGHLHGVCMPAKPLVRRQSLEGAVGRILCSTEEISNNRCPASRIGRASIRVQC